jgi:hypothetical protein
MHTERLEASVRAELINVAKSQIELIHVVSEDRTKHDAANQDDMITAKSPHDVVIFLPNFVVRGRLHLLADVNRYEALEFMREDFVAITSASILPAHGMTATARQAPFVSVSKHHVLAMYFDSVSA